MVFAIKSKEIPDLTKNQALNLLVKKSFGGYSMNEIDAEKRLVALEKSHAELIAAVRELELIIVGKYYTPGGP